MSPTWDLQTNEDVLKAMNCHFHPNASDCREMMGMLRKKGYTFTDGALL